MDDLPKLKVHMIIDIVQSILQKVINMSRIQQKNTGNLKRGTTITIVHWKYCTDSMKIVHCEKLLDKKMSVEKVSI